MHEDRSIRDARKLGEDALGLANGVAKERRGPLRAFVVFPPFDDFSHDRLGPIPSIDRQTKRGLGDERVAPHGFERRAGGIGGALVVSQPRPKLPSAILDSDLRRSQDVTCGMERDADAAERQRVAVRQGFDACLRPEPAFQEAPGRFGAQVGLAARPRVIAVDVRNQRAFGRSPGIHVEAAGRAVETRGAFDQHRPQRARRALMNSQTTGRIEMKMMMIATSEKFSLTIGTLPKT